MKLYKFQVCSSIIHHLYLVCSPPKGKPPSITMYHLDTLFYVLTSPFPLRWSPYSCLCLYTPYSCWSKNVSKQPSSAFLHRIEFERPVNWSNLGLIINTPKEDMFKMWPTCLQSDGSMVWRWLHYLGVSSVCKALY